MVSRISCSITSLGTEVRLMGLQFYRSSFLPFLRTGMTFTFFQYLGTCPDHHNLSKIIGCGLAMTSASSFSACGCVLLRHHGLVWVCFVLVFPNTIVFHCGFKSSLLQTFSCVSGAWDSWRPVSPLRTKAKKAFFMSFVTRAPAPLSSGFAFSLVFLLLLTHLSSPFL